MNPAKEMFLVATGQAPAQTPAAHADLAKRLQDLPAVADFVKRLRDLPAGAAPSDVAAAHRAVSAARRAVSEAHRAVLLSAARLPLALGGDEATLAPRLARYFAEYRVGSTCIVTAADRRAILAVTWRGELALRHGGVTYAPREPALAIKAFLCLLYGAVVEVTLDAARNMVWRAPTGVAGERDLIANYATRWGLTPAESTHMRRALGDMAQSSLLDEAMASAAIPEHIKRRIALLLDVSLDAFVVASRDGEFDA
jgi:hypothetical protein